MTDAEITKKLDEAQKQYFEGNQAKFVKGLMTRGTRSSACARTFRLQVLTEKIYEKLTNDLKVTIE